MFQAVYKVQVLSSIVMHQLALSSLSKQVPVPQASGFMPLSKDEGIKIKHAGVPQQSKNTAQSHHF